MLNALLTPLLAIITTTILVCQFKLAHQRWRLDLYDKRYPVFDAVREYLLRIGQEADIDLEQLFKFHRDCRDKDLLFGKEIQEYLLNLYNKGVDLHSMEDRIQKFPQGDDRKKLCEENSKLLKWFLDQFDVSKELFGKYLRIDTK